MGLNSYVFDLLATHCKRPQGGGKLLVAGYPDFLVDAATLVKHLGRHDFPKDPRSDILKMGHTEPGLDYCRCPEPVFEALGYNNMVVIDIRQEQGCEIIIDLNESHIFEVTNEYYDLVLDHGTIEHIFNIGKAAKSLADAVVPGGFIVQHLPLNFFNHGFYNINPCWFKEFYQYNGFEIIVLEAWCWQTKHRFKVPTNTQFANVPEQSLITCVAKRAQMKEIKWPIQAAWV